jgi:hypothetical protein
MAAILAHEKVAPLLSDDHFSVDGTLVEAWASFKSFKAKVAAAPESPPPTGPPSGDPPPPDTGCGTAGTGTGSMSEVAGGASEMSKADGTAQDGSGHAAAAAGEIGRNVERDWRRQRWSNATHACVTDPDARLYRKAKGRPAQLCYMGHAITENRNGFVVEATLTHADGTAERRAAVDMLDALDPGSTRRITLGADKGYDVAEFVEQLRTMRVTPHIAAKAKGSAIDGRTTRHAGYAVSQRKRKLVEEPFGWGKTVGPIGKTMLRGVQRVCAQFTLTMTAYNLAKLPRLLAA